MPALPPSLQSTPQSVVHPAHAVPITGVYQGMESLSRVQRNRHPKVGLKQLLQEEHLQERLLLCREQLLLKVRGAPPTSSSCTCSSPLWALSTKISLISYKALTSHSSSSISLTSKSGRNLRFNECVPLQHQLGISANYRLWSRCTFKDMTGMMLMSTTVVSAYVAVVLSLYLSHLNMD